MSNRIGDPAVATVDLCALAERVLGLRCTKHKRAERYSLHLIKVGRASGPGRLMHSGLTTDELRAKIAKAATDADELAKIKWRAVYDRRARLPEAHRDQREALERRQAADTAKTEVDFDEAEAACDEAAALLAEVRAALGEATP